MKLLVIFRHGTAKPYGAGIDDFMRPLTNKGRSECRAIGERLRSWFSSTGFEFPGLLLCSSSVRTKESARHLLDASNQKCEVKYEESLYLQNETGILSTLNDQPDTLGGVILCGHNPGLSYLAARLFDSPVEGVPPAGAIVGAMEIESWGQAGIHPGELKAKLYPW